MRGLFDNGPDPTVLAADAAALNDGWFRIDEEVLDGGTGFGFLGAEVVLGPGASAGAPAG